MGCAYRAAGYDFIAITDHHRYFPSLEGKAAFNELTNEFTVFKGEEIALAFYGGWALTAPTGKGNLLLTIGAK